jgi:Glyoxalase-like domain
VSADLELDHVLLATHDLAAAARELELHGLASVEGGRHPGFGTENRIVPLGDAYLELVSVADEADAACTAFGRWVAAGRSVPFSPLGWAVRTSRLDEHAKRLGLAVESGARARAGGGVLRWRSAGLAAAAAEPCLPFFIAWEPGTVLPGRSPVRHSAGGVAVAHLVLDGAPARLADWLGGARLPIAARPGAPALAAIVLGADGAELVLGER